MLDFLCRFPVDFDFLNQQAGLLPIVSLGRISGRPALASFFILVQDGVIVAFAPVSGLHGGARHLAEGYLVQAAQTLLRERLLVFYVENC